ncbi:MAG: L-ribulose-5-phosphate 3-epimerase [Lachnospiraceae bacterium]
MKQYTIGMYEKAVPATLNWKERLQVAKEVGYDFVEISIDETEEKIARLDMSKEERLHFVELMNETNMPIRTLNLSGNRKYPLGCIDEKVAKKGMEMVCKAIDFADDLGIRIVMIPGYDEYYNESTEVTRANFEKNLKIVVSYAAKKSVILAFETMETEFMNMVSKSVEIVQKINSPYLKIYPDIGNMNNAAILENKNVLCDLVFGKGHIAALHLKETVPGKYRDMKYGEGCVDFENIIKVAWELGIRKYVTEIWYLGSKEWKKDLKQSFDAMSKILDMQS